MASPNGAEKMLYTILHLWLSHAGSFLVVTHWTLQHNYLYFTCIWLRIAIRYWWFKVYKKIYADVQILHHFTKENYISATVIIYRHSRASTTWYCNTGTIAMGFSFYWLEESKKSWLLPIQLELFVAAPILNIQVGQLLKGKRHGLSFIFATEYNINFDGC